ncbi:MAG: integration host factor subunit alpha [Nitrospirae bacterium]|nr:integration host factor subunit alpha [Nitrospirota bacterium]
MTKADLVNHIYEKVGLSKKEASDMVEVLFETIKESLSQGGSIKLSGFGTFSVRNKGSRRGRNPKTGVEIEIEPRRVVTFKPSVQFKTQVESGGDS